MAPETKKALGTAAINFLLVTGAVVAGIYISDKFVPKPAPKA